jgi:hypothetical protein
VQKLGNGGSSKRKKANKTVSSQSFIAGTGYSVLLTYLSQKDEESDLTEPSDEEEKVPHKPKAPIKRKLKEMHDEVVPDMKPTRGKRLKRSGLSQTIETLTVTEQNE